MRKTVLICLLALAAIVACFRSDKQWKERERHRIATEMDESRKREVQIEAAIHILLEINARSEEAYRQHLHDKLGRLLERL